MLLFAQEEAGRGAGAGAVHPAAQRAAQEGGRRTGRHLSPLPQDQVRRRGGPRVPVLSHQVLCQVRRKSHPTLK